MGNAVRAVTRRHFLHLREVPQLLMAYGLQCLTRYSFKSTVGCARCHQERRGMIGFITREDWEIWGITDFQVVEKVQNLRNIDANY